VAHGPITLSLVVPAYNQRARSTRAAAAAGKFLATHYGDRAELIVVDDGSAPEQRLHAEDLPPGAVLVTHPQNLGKGGAIRSGVARARGENIVFTDSDGHQKRPIMVHRAILGSMERFIGGLIEHFAGKFPLWCAPKQVALIPIREEHADYVRQVSARLRAEGLRVECMDHPAHLNKKIKEATHEKVPFLLIAGDREVQERSVTVRQRDVEQQQTVPFEDFRRRSRALQVTRRADLGSADDR